jgi:hypothetical protein
MFILPRGANAHIKWFEPFDVTQAPAPPSEVLTASFVYLFLLSGVLVYVFFLIDRIALRRGILASFDNRLKMFDNAGILILRVAGGVFFVSLFAWSKAYGVVFYLTPELVTQSSVVPWLQLAIGLAALSSVTMPLMAVGVLYLFVLAVADYGLFHMLDYIVFLGIAYFYLASGSKNRSIVKSAFVTLFATTGINFLWLSVEKFAYPQWTYPLLEKNPDLLFGMSPQIFMNVAGFVEILFIFTLLGAASALVRLVAFGFQMLFVLAIFKFGLIDAIGHLMIIAILFVLVVRGPTDARNILVLKDKSIQMEAYFMTGLYYFAVVNAFIAYYGLHHLLVPMAR